MKILLTVVSVLSLGSHLFAAPDLVVSKCANNDHYVYISLENTEDGIKGNIRDNYSSGEFTCENGVHGRSHLVCQGEWSFSKKPILINITATKYDHVRDIELPGNQYVAASARPFADWLPIALACE